MPPVAPHKTHFTRTTFHCVAHSEHMQYRVAEARTWALMAAGQGNAASMTRLGLLYHNALGVERDPRAAADWWEQAAQLGDGDAQAMLGAAYHLGSGRPRDPVTALAWFKRARVNQSPFADRCPGGGPR